MNKPVLGMVIGAVLGVFDGLTALLYPDTRPLIASILMGSSVKGLVAGLLIGLFARKVRSIPWGVLFGLAITLLFAYLVAMEPVNGRYYYLEIMLPGGIVGMILGIVTQKFPQPKTQPQT